jgi:hypothetical protein
MRKSDRLSPKARKEQLVIKELANETLVYDETNHKAHCLNETAALVWKSCDGRTSVPQMTRLLAEEMNAPVPEQVVWLAIKQLEESRLLDVAITHQSWLPQTSRRELVRRLGIAAVVLPLITSIQAPVAAQAGSCVPLGQPCVGAGLGNCCPGPNIACGGGPNCHVT